MKTDLPFDTSAPRRARPSQIERHILTVSCCVPAAIGVPNELYARGVLEALEYLAPMGAVVFDVSDGAIHRELLSRCVLRATHSSPFSPQRAFWGVTATWTSFHSQERTSIRWTSLISTRRLIVSQAVTHRIRTSYFSRRNIGRRGRCQVAFVLLIIVIARDQRLRTARKPISSMVAQPESNSYCRNVSLQIRFAHAFQALTNYTSAPDMCTEVSVRLRPRTPSL